MAFLRSNKKQQIEFTVSTRTLLQITAFLIGTIFVLRLLETIRHPLTLIFVSFFLALALNPVVTRLASELKSKSRVMATAIAYGVVTTILVAFVMLIVPPLINQTTDFIHEVPQTLSDIKNQDSSLGNFVRRYELEEQINNFANDWSRNLGSVQGPVLNAANRVFANVVSIITVFVLTFMMLVEGPRWLGAFWRYMPTDRRERYKVLAGKMYRVVTSYVNGQVLVATIGASFSLIALIIMSTLFGVSVNAIALAGIVFLFGLIPTIGAIMGASIVALFCLFVSPALAVSMIVYFIIYQQVENATIQPYIQSRGNELTPMLVFIAAILGIGLGGVLGGFVAIPLAGCLKVLFDNWIENREQQHVVKKA